MNPPDPPTLIWAHEGRALVGTGRVQAFDPGTGPDRYEKALVALQETGRPVGYASFGFDPDAEGSIVLVPDEVTEIATGELPHSPVPMSPGRIISDGAGEWMSGIARALESLEARSVAKVVLSRQVEAIFESDLPTAELVRRLHLDQPSCYTFAVDGLVGASPELLVSLSGGLISSLALAGTAVEARDLESAKIDREHWYTASSVEAALTAHVSDLEKTSRRVVDFGEIKHLASRFSGRVIPGTSVLDVLGSLHPTAAVAGTPTEQALSLIREIEPTGRGRYAGPVGWFNAEGEGEFAIALRCGLVAGATVTLYAGGGIVVGSDPRSEFNETELKLRPMRKALMLWP